MIEDTLINKIEDIIQEKFELELEDGFVMLEIPNKKEQGDYSTNVAMRLT